MTLNQYIKLFTDISQAHKQVKYFGFGPIHEYLDSNVNTELGSHLWLEIDKSNITGGVKVNSFNLYCMDYVNKDVTNRNDVLSDTERILGDVIALLSNPYYYDFFELDENFQFQVFYDDKHSNEACGWWCTIGLKQDFIYDSCAVPIDGIPTGNGTYVINTPWNGQINWGDITGTLSNQTDLQNALNLKVPTSRTLTINGTTYDLSANRSWTISTGGENLSQTLAIGNNTNGQVILVDDNDTVYVGSNSSRGITFNPFSNPGLGVFNNNSSEYFILLDSGGLNFSGTVISMAELSYLFGLSSNAQTQLNAKENSSNKTNTVTGNETSTSLYLSVKGYYDYLITLVWLTAQIWGTWISGLTAKTTPVDADYSTLMDSADSNKAKKVSWANIKATLKTYFDTLYSPVKTKTTDTQSITGTSMTVPNTPSFTYGVYRNGQFLTPTTDYSITGAVITFVDTLATDSITIVYEY